MWYEWNRFLFWLNENAGAVQALCAIAMVVSSIATVVITVLYVRLTKSIADSTRRQLAASLQPSIEMQLATGPDIEAVGFATRTFAKNVTLAIRNTGTAPLKLKALYVVVQRWDGNTLNAQYEVDLNQDRNRVLIPGGELNEVDVPIDVRGREDFEATFGLHVDCSDLSELRIHSFFWHPSGAVRHCVRAE